VSLNLLEGSGNTTMAKVRPRRPKPVDLMANSWTCGTVREVLEGTWTPWLTWLIRAYDTLPGRRPVTDGTDPVAMWRAVRDQVLLSLEELGLAATVSRTDDPLPVALEDHLADLAGLVHVHRSDGDYCYSPQLPSEILLGRTAADRHALRMLADHELVPAGPRLPVRLRSFCGQAGDTESDLLGASRTWRDHVHAWATLAGEPVLSVEPYTYADDPAQLVRDVARDVEANGLPLRVEGPFPGTWADTAVLVLIRHDTDRAVCLPALRTAPGIWLNAPRRATLALRQHNVAASHVHTLTPRDLRGDL
jgi:hypothetical protein